MSNIPNPNNYGQYTANRYGQPPQQPPMFMPRPPEQKKPRKWLVPVLCAAALFLGIGIGNSAGGAESTAAAPAAVTVTQTQDKGGATVTAKETVQVTVTAAAPEPKKEPEKKQENTIGEGVHKIGEIPVGRYTTTVPAGSWGCYWARLKNDSGSFDAIIANANLMNEGAKGSVTIKESDGFLELKGDCQWTKVG